MASATKLLATAAAILVSMPASSAPPVAAPTPPSEPRYAMPFTQMWDMTADDGQVYRVFVSYPETEMPADGYPVLYVLDGNAAFAGFAEARRSQEYYDTGKALVVSVGYPTDKAYDLRRLDDLTSKMPSPPPAKLRALAQYKSGGQDRFLDFLTGKLRAEIGRRFKIDPDRQSLFGHSLGGIFALHALYTRPQAFYSIVAASPSLDWNDQAELADERQFVTRLTAGKIGRTSRLMIVIGGRDIDDDPEPAAALYRRLDLLSGYGLRTRLRRYEEEGHMGVPSRAITDTLRFAFEQHY